ncbi:hypothetical protein B0H13DRAFT_1877272 [Mycena leptocephala]|nr:hypothetical protein B0H13DRAFT_1877272 [Mycena leptocephala]
MTLRIRAILLSAPGDFSDFWCGRYEPSDDGTTCGIGFGRRFGVWEKSIKKIIFSPFIFPGGSRPEMRSASTITPYHGAWTHQGLKYVVTIHPQGKSENTTSISSSTPWVVDFGISVPTNNASRMWNTIIISITFELGEVVQKFRCRDDIGCGLHDNTPSRAGFCCDGKKTVTGRATHLNLSPRTQTEVATCQVATFIPQNANTSCNLPGCDFYPPEPKQKLQLVRLRCPSSPRTQTEVTTSVSLQNQIKTIRIGVPRLVPRARQCPPQTSMPFIPSSEWDGCMYENFAETACSVLDYWIWLPRILEPKHLAIVLGALPVEKWKWTAQRREDL